MQTFYFYGRSLVDLSLIIVRFFIDWFICYFFSLLSDFHCRNLNSVPKSFYSSHVRLVASDRGIKIGQG
jgi:hypothetical protein